MKKAFYLILFISLVFLGCESKTATEYTDASGDAVKPANELLDMKTSEPIAKAFEAFAKGDIDGFIADLDDNVRMTWSSGDSLIGKQAVKDYWVGRWKLIESVNFSDHIFVPIMVHESQSAYAPAGKWILHWTFAHVTYKNGKKLDFWVHHVNHFNDADKIDFLGQYLDRHPIVEAVKDLATK